MSSKTYDDKNSAEYVARQRQYELIWNTQMDKRDHSFWFKHFGIDLTSPELKENTVLQLVKSNGEICYRTHQEVVERDKKMEAEHEVWVKKTAENKLIDKNKVEKYPEEKILNYPFLRDENGKVNLTEYDDGREVLAKLQFISTSFLALARMGAVENDLEAFREVDYDDITTMLVENNIIAQTPEIGTELDDDKVDNELNNVLSSNGIDLPDNSSRIISDFQENESDTSLGKWLKNGVNKIAKSLNFNK